MNAQIELRQYISFTKPQKFDTADIKCFTMFWDWLCEVLRSPFATMGSMFDFTPFYFY